MSGRLGCCAAPTKVAALVLAAGLSSRMAPDNKLLLRNSAGETLVARVVDAALASRAAGVWVVVGHQADAVAAALDGRDVGLIHAPEYASGLAFSLRAGFAALPGEASGALVCLGDMPEVSSAVIDQIIGGFDPADGRSIIVPVHRAQRGNPVLWDRRFFPEILALAGDTGARGLLTRHSAHVREIEVGSPGVLRDYDTPQSLIDRF